MAPRYYAADLGSGEFALPAEEMHHLGADVRLDAAGFDIGIRPSWEQAMDDVRKAVRWN